VQSVDLVADPATTRGLFESAEDTGNKGGSPIFAETIIGTVPETATPLSLDELKRDYPELVESICQEQATEIERLRQELGRLTALEAAGRKRGVALRLLHEFGLPEPESDDPTAETVCGKRFFESLLAAGDERAMRELVEERSRLVRMLSEKRSGVPSVPQSRDQHLVDGVAPLDAKSFAAAIT
jgi:hypothetical protein